MTDEFNLVKSTLSSSCLCQFTDIPDFDMLLSPKMKPTRETLIKLYEEFLIQKGKHIPYSPKLQPSETLKKFLNKSGYELVYNIIKTECTDDGSSQVLSRGPAAIYFVNLPVQSWIGNICSGFKLSRKELFVYDSELGNKKRRAGILNDPNYRLPLSLGCRQTKVKLIAEGGTHNYFDLFYTNIEYIAEQFLGSNKPLPAKGDVPDDVISLPGYGIVFLPSYKRKPGDFALQCNQVMAISAFADIQRTRKDLVFIFVIERFFRKNNKNLQKFTLLLSENDLLKYIKIHPNNSSLGNLDLVMTLHPHPRHFSDIEFGLHELALLITKNRAKHEDPTAPNYLRYFDRQNEYTLPGPTHGFDFSLTQHVSDFFPPPWEDSECGYESRRYLRDNINKKMMSLYMLGFWADCDAEFQKEDRAPKYPNVDVIYPYRLFGALEDNRIFGIGYTQEMMSWIAFVLTILHLCEEKAKHMKNVVDMMSLTYESIEPEVDCVSSPGHSHDSEYGYDPYEEEF